MQGWERLYFLHPLFVLYTCGRPVTCSWGWNLFKWKFTIINQRINYTYVNSVVHCLSHNLGLVFHKPKILRTILSWETNSCWGSREIFRNLWKSKFCRTYLIICDACNEDMWHSCCTPIVGITVEQWSIGKEAVMVQL